MFNPFVRRILTLGLLMRDLAASVAGYFVWKPGLPVGAAEREGTEAAASDRVEPTGRRRLPGMSAALFLLGVAVMEGLAAIRAFAR
jgi:hypothetical protein